MQSAQVSITDARHCLNCSLSYMSIQPLGGLDHPPGIDSAGPYPAMNHVNALPPTTYTSSMGYDYPSHLVTVRVRFVYCLMSSLLTVASSKGPAVAPGPGCGPPQLERYAPTIPVRVLPPPAPFPCTHMQPFLPRL